MRTYFQLRAGRLDEVKGEVVREQLSSEMLLKAARMGVPLIASRTSPTEMAVALAEQLGVTVVGYVRGENFNLYAGEAIALPGAA